MGLHLQQTKHDHRRSSTRREPSASNWFPALPLRTSSPSIHLRKTALKKIDENRHALALKKRSLIFLMQVWTAKEERGLTKL